MGETLKEYGNTFQVKVIAALLTDREFLNQIYDILLPEYFDSKSLNFLCKSTFDYFKEYRKLPTVEVYKVQLSNIENELDKAEAKNSLVEVWKNRESDDLDFIKKELHSFCTNQVIKKAILDSVDLLKRGNYEQIKTNIDNALKITDKSKSKGLDYLEDIDYRYSEEEVKERISTGWAVIDELMGGGLPKGNMASILAPSGVGKSWLLCCLGAAALKAGKTVIHYTLELNDIYTAQRYDTIITGMESDDLKHNIDVIKKKLSKITNGKLIIEEHPSGTLSQIGWVNSIDKHIMMGRKPDLVIVDYPEIMKVNYNDNMREDKVLSELYKDMRGEAGMKDFALWVADQTNREGDKQEVAKGNTISNSFAKKYHLDFMLTWSRHEKNVMNDTAQGFVDKSRLGPDKMTLPAYCDLNRGKIEFYHPNTDKGQSTKEKMVSTEEYDREQAAQLFNKFQQQKGLNGTESKNII